MVGMIGIGGLDVLALTVVMWAVAAYLGYWVLRTAISHGIQDAHRRRDAQAVGAGDPRTSPDA
jgi:hypothetical protein